MPLLGGSRQNTAMTFGMEKLEWFGYPMLKIIWRYNYSFWQNSRMWQTDGHCMTAWPMLAQRHAAKTVSRLQFDIYDNMTSLLSKTHIIWLTFSRNFGLTWMLVVAVWGGGAEIGHAGSMWLTRTSIVYNFLFGNKSFHVWRNLNIACRVFSSTCYRNTLYSR